MPPLLPAQLDVFSAEVIPLLQRRGLFRTEYEGSMLREHYGLPWPKSVFDDPDWAAEPLQAVAGL
jgi:N-acetyl-S-(2-succino)cysteine monooxygenase